MRLADAKQGMDAVMLVLGANGQHLMVRWKATGNIAVKFPEQEWRLQAQPAGTRAPSAAGRCQCRRRLPLLKQ
jgi:hypothetical protein